MKHRYSPLEKGDRGVKIAELLYKSGGNVRKIIISIIAIMAMTSAVLAKSGIGYDDFNKAISYKYLAPKVGLQVEASTNYIGYKASDTVKVNSNVLNLTGIILYPVATAGQFHLNAGLGVSYIINSNIGQVEGLNRNDMGIKVELVPEYYVTPNFSFESAFGVNFNMWGETTNDTIGYEDNYKSIVTFGYPVSLNGGLVFHYYFKK